jgi:predicted permease
VDSLLNDVRFAFRTLLKQPAFTAAVVATLALAIGASTAIFSVVEATLLRSLPFRTPERLAFLWGVAGPGRAVRGASVIEVQDWARRTHTLQNIAIYDETSLNLRTTEGADRVQAEMVSASFFPMLGASAQRGRVFTPDQDRVPDAHAVAVISDAMWTTRFARDPQIVGRNVVLNETPFTIIGVMQPWFRGLSFDTDVWFPAMMAHVAGAPTDLTDRGTRWLGAVGRLEDGVSMTTAQADMDRVAGELAAEFPRSNHDRGVQLSSLRTSYLGSTETVFLAVFAAVSLLLLIACANVVGLQLVRASGRRREFALRIAIGADRGRLIQQLTVEGLVIALASAIVGLIVAQYALQALIALSPPGLLPNYATPTIDVVAFAFAFVVAVGCGVVFGLVPAIRSARVSLTESLKEGARGSATSTGGGRRLGAQQFLVVGETAISLLLLVGAGLYVRSLANQLAVSPGFDPQNVLRARFSFPSSYSSEARLQFLDRLQARLTALPSVRAVAFASDMPLAGSTDASFIYIIDANQSVRYYRHAVTPDYFSTLHVRLVAGRTFTPNDRAGMPLVVVINEATARRFWPGQQPVGKTIRLGSDSAPPATIVGVVGDVRQRDLTTALTTSEPDVYLPLAQRASSSIHVAIRADRAPEALVAPVRHELARLDPTISLFGIQTLESLLTRQTASGRFASTVLGVFGIAALLLTGIGLYGVLAFTVALRRREIGIRMALGATNQRVSRVIVSQGLRLVLIGVMAGVVASLLLTRWIASQLYGITAHDPAVFAAVPLTMLGVAALASWLPARRAAQVDPQIALRSE